MSGGQRTGGQGWAGWVAGWLVLPRLTSPSCLPGRQGFSTGLFVCLEGALSLLAAAEPRMGCNSVLGHVGVPTSALPARCLSLHLAPLSQHNPHSLPSPHHTPTSAGTPGHHCILSVIYHHPLLCSALRSPVPMPAGMRSTLLRRSLRSWLTSKRRSRRRQPCKAVWRQPQVRQQKWQERPAEHEAAAAAGCVHTRGWLLLCSANCGPIPPL